MIDTGVILGVVVINALIGFLQERRAERSLDAIRGLIALKATVVRDGPLRRGFYPAGRVIPIRLPSLPRPGLYRLQLNAVLTSGVPASRGLYFRHTGG